MTTPEEEAQTAASAQTAAFLAVLHAVHELCVEKADHGDIDALVAVNAREFAEAGLAFLTRLSEAERDRDGMRAATFEEGRRAGLSLVRGLIREAPKTWSADQVLSQVVEAVKPAVQR